MATQTGLVRSFYGWLHKTESKLRRTQSGAPLLSKLPTTRPTSLSEITAISSRVCEVLQGTEHVERAEHWKGIFKGIERDGWRDDPTVGSNSREET